jgi:integrase
MANKTKSSIAHAPNVTLRKMKIKKGFTLYLDIYSDGKRTKEYLHLQVTGNKDLDKETIELAKKIHAKRILEIQSEQHGEFNRSKINSNFVEFFEVNALKRPMRDKRKTNKWTNTLNYIKEYKGNQVSFNQITSDWIEGFKEFLLSKLKRNSAATYYETLKASLNLAVRNRIIKENPCFYTDNISRKQNDRVFLDLEEISLLDKTPCPQNEDVKRAFLFAYFTGLRLSDVKALTWQQVVNGKIKFRQKKTGEFEIMSLSEQAKKYLGKRVESEETVFKLKEDENTRRVIIKWAKASKLGKTISFHTSRHTFATMALTYGVDIYTVSKLLGHSELKNTQIYAKIIDKKKQEAVNMLPKL